MATKKNEETERLVRATALSDAVIAMIDATGGMPKGTMIRYDVCHKAFAQSDGSKVNVGDIVISVYRHEDGASFEFVVETPEDPCTEENFVSTLRLISSIRCKAIHLREAECPCN